MSDRKLWNEWDFEILHTSGSERLLRAIIEAKVLNDFDRVQELELELEELLEEGI